MAFNTTITQDLDSLYKFANDNKLSLGIKTAQRKFKGLINDSDLPFLLIRVGPARWTMQTLTWRLYERTYRHEVFVKPVVEGLSGFQEGYEAVLPIMQAFGDYILANLRVNNEIMHISPPFNDSGVVEMGPFGGKTYWGFWVDVPVTEKYS